MNELNIDVNTQVYGEYITSCCFKVDNLKLFKLFLKSE